MVGATSFGSRFTGWCSLIFLDGLRHVHMSLGDFRSWKNGPWELHNDVILVASHGTDAKKSTLQVLVRPSPIFGWLKTIFPNLWAHLLGGMNIHLYPAIAQWLSSSHSTPYGLPGCGPRPGYLSKDAFNLTLMSGGSSSAQMIWIFDRLDSPVNSKIFKCWNDWRLEKIQPLPVFLSFYQLLYQAFFWGIGKKPKKNWVRIQFCGRRRSIPPASEIAASGRGFFFAQPPTNAEAFNGWWRMVLYGNTMDIFADPIVDRCR